MDLHPYLALLSLAGYVLLVTLTAGSAVWDDLQRRNRRGDTDDRAKAEGGA
jgi:hypothetical protein